MLQVKDLSFDYGNNISILDKINLHVERGQMCGLFGPNGCGKTTLFKCCLKFLSHTGGAVHMNGQDVKGIPISRMAQTVSYVPQEHKPPFPYLVKDVVLMGRTPHLRGVFGVSAAHKKKAAEAMDLIGIRELSSVPYNQLSGGQRQMVLIARAVAQETPLLFLDEPTSALDFRNQIKIMNILRQIADQGTTIVVCTHDPNHVLWFCDSVVVMDQCGVVAQGVPNDVMCDGVLEDIYEDMCQVRQLGTTRMVVPRNIATSGVTV
ncbi:MAG: ABC transporter ATP-binding protein [Desulfovibrio sp.]